MDASKIDFLTPKQQLFCDEYLTDRNATRAALRAGYSSETALNGALMRKPKIKAYITQHMKSDKQKRQDTRALLLNELTRVALVNMGDYFAEDGSAKPMHLLTNDEKIALWYVKVDKHGAVTYKMHNKLAAIEKIAKLLQLYLPEVAEPKTEYVYLDKKAICDEDRFEDTTVDAPELPFEEPIEFCDEEGNALYEGPIPYSPTSTIFAFDMRDKPPVMLEKLKLYEQMQQEVEERVGCPHVNIRAELSKWLTAELALCGVDMWGNGFVEIYHLFRALRVVRKKAATVGIAA